MNCRHRYNIFTINVFTSLYFCQINKPQSCIKYHPSKIRNMQSCMKYHPSTFYLHKKRLHCFNVKCFIVESTTEDDFSSSVPKYSGYPTNVLIGEHTDNYNRQHYSVQQKLITVYYECTNYCLPLSTEIRPRIQHAMQDY